MPSYIIQEWKNNNENYINNIKIMRIMKDDDLNENTLLMYAKWLQPIDCFPLL